MQLVRVFPELNQMRIFSEIYHHHPVAYMLIEFSISKEEMCASSFSEIQRTGKRLAPSSEVSFVYDLILASTKI